MSPPVKVTVEGAIGIIELARPEKFNCMSKAAMTAIDAAREQFENDERVRAILVRALGKHFCTGADLDEVKSLRASEDDLRTFVGHGMDVLMRLEASPLPVVAAVHGLCLAGGTELMLAADVVFAARSAKFGDQHAQFGLIPGWGGSQRLARVMGVRPALDLMLSARWLDAHESRTAGLVNYVVDDDKLNDEAMAYCVKLTERSRAGLAEMKRLAREGVELRLRDAMNLELEAAVRHIMGSDVTEGLAAFQERRKPRFV
jgi:enoyl-CoA hydratase/carnithine racemase